MRKAANWALGIAFVLLLIDWTLMGIKLLDHNDMIIVEAYIGLICFVVIFISVLIRCFTDRCPHCGKIRVGNGPYCSYCGQKIK